MTIFFMLWILIFNIHEMETKNINNFPSILSLEVNSNQLMNDLGENASFENISVPSKNLLTELSSDKIIESSDIFLSEEIYTDTLQSIDNLGLPSVGIFKFKGMNNNIFFDANIGIINFIEGCISNSRYGGIEPAIISKDIALTNNLKVGDTVNLNILTDLTEIKNKSFPFEIRIVGIYDIDKTKEAQELIKIDKMFKKNIAIDFNEDNHNFETELSEKKMAIIKNQINTIYLLNDSIEMYLDRYNDTIGKSVDKKLVYQATFLLRDRSQLNRLNKSLNDKLPKYFHFKNSKQEYRDLTPNVQYNSFYMILISIILFVIMLFIIIITLFFYMKMNSEIIDVFVINGYSKKQINYRITFIKMSNVIFLIILSNILGKFLFIIEKDKKLIDFFITNITNENDILYSNLTFLSYKLIDLSKKIDVSVYLSLNYLLFSFVIYFIVFIVIKLSINIFIRKFSKIN